MKLPPTNDRHGIFPVTEFGAKGDGSSNDTQALQRTIEACAKSGGGRVLVPPGVYCTGTLYLRDNVELHLLVGATLLGSPDRSDYNADDVFPENFAFGREQVTGAHLIIAHRVENVAITGHGVIDGNSREFFHPLTPTGRAPSYRAPRRMFAIREWRPGQMIWMCGCRQVSIQDVTLRNSPYWTLLLLGCENIAIRGLSVTNPPETPNGDGIDIDCSRNVTVSGCRIFTGDDCLTLRANSKILPEPMECANVVVSDCILSSSANCVRVGVGDGAIRDCLLNNLVCVDSRVGINLQALFPGPWERGALIENVTFSNLNIDAILALQALHGTGAKPGRGFRNIGFHNVRARVTAGAYLAGNADNYAENISFRDWDIHFHDETSAPEFVDRVRFPDPIPGCEGNDGERALPAALYARHVDGLRCRGVCVHLPTSLQRKLQRKVWFEHCRNVDRQEERVS